MSPNIRVLDLQMTTTGHRPGDSRSSLKRGIAHPTICGRFVRIRAAQAAGTEPDDTPPNASSRDPRDHAEISPSAPEAPRMDAATSPLGDEYPHFVLFPTETMSVPTDARSRT